MLPILFRTVFWPAVVLTSVSGNMETGQPWFGPSEPANPRSSWPWISVVVSCRDTVPLAQLFAVSFAQ